MASATIQSCPSRGTWIEILVYKPFSAEYFRRAPRGARGLKFLLLHHRHLCGVSCPSRGTWIEIQASNAADFWANVVPLAGHVD